jgi:hypothetical protein
VPKIGLKIKPDLDRCIVHPITSEASTVQEHDTITKETNKTKCFEKDFTKNDEI